MLKDVSVYPTIVYRDNARESRHMSKSFIVEGKPGDENNNETKSKSQPNSVYDTFDVV